MKRQLRPVAIIRVKGWLDMTAPSKPKNWNLALNVLKCPSFADGHTELKKWKDSRTTPPQLTPSGSGYPAGVASPNNPDLFWLQDRCTRKTK